MNITLKQENHGHYFLHKIIDTDTNEEIKGILSFNLNIDGNRLPIVELRSLGGVEFEGVVGLKIITENKENKNDK